MPMSTSEQVASHYTSEDTLKRIDAHLREQGIDPEHPTLEDLAPFDNFHSRGLGATLDVIAMADFPEGARVLDVGGGLGGPARVLASRANVQVTVLDLTPSFVETGRILSERVGLSSQVDFDLGDGTKMPYVDGSFDGAWTQHSTMNIDDKEALYSEIHRVLKPGGRLAMHEVMKGPTEGVDYPMPWAISQESSFLRAPEAVRALIKAAGFRELIWEDETENVIASASPAPGSGPSTQPPGQTVLWGPAFVQRIQNMGRDLREGKLVVIRALFERV
jgi:SAM-dependent methyltransferase